MADRNIQIDTDCEGPLALNDNAFELCREFIKPGGDRLFRQLSRYEDFLVDIAKKPDYQAGDTLKFVLPFLKAVGLTNAQITEYSWKTIKLIQGVEKTYQFLKAQGWPLFEISTSYRQFAEAVGLKLGFAPDHIYCTELDLDKYEISPGEAQELMRLKDEIGAAPDLELPPEAKTPEDLPAAAQETIAQLDRVFFEKIPRMDIGVIYREVSPLGGPEKARAIEDSLAKTGLSLANTIYVGDSITDVPAFEAIRAGGGLGISFNGNRDAVNAAEIIVVADTAWPIALLACIFQMWGKDGVLEVAAPETPDKPRNLVLPEAVIEYIARGLKGRTFNLYSARNLQRERIIKESAAMRAKLRGAAVAELG